jgi:ATP-dependent phosphofructokinase / diphosphate-dependent phosphofructokinase
MQDFAATGGNFMKRIAILTGGGDAPGLNAVIRAVVKTAESEFQSEILGVRNGFEGFLDPNGIFPLTRDTVRGILPRGGTILGTANRGNPFARSVIRNGETVIVDTSDEVIAAVRQQNLDALIIVGGDGTLHIANQLHQRGLPVIGVPKTIDNDISGTEFTFGFDTAVTTATEAIDKLHTTAESHHRVMVLELMGRDAGFIALYAGIAGGADVILIPEIPFHFEAICKKIRLRVQRGSTFSIISVAEGAHPAGGSQEYRTQGDSIYIPRLGGIGEIVANYVNDTCKIESRVTVLGHLQRGGSPSSFDRLLATRFGAEAVRQAAQKNFGVMVALQSSEIVPVSLATVLEIPKRVPVDGDVVRTARGMGISFGDEIE